MRRRRFLEAASAGVAAGLWPAWLSEAFADEAACDTGWTARVAQIAAAFRRAQEAGERLLVFVIPADDGEKWARGEAFGELLNFGSDRDLAPLAGVEVACATMADLKRLVPTAGAGEPSMVLIDPSRSPATARQIDFVLPPYPDLYGDKPMTWEERQKAEDAISDQRIAAMGKALREALGSDDRKAPALAAEVRGRLRDKRVPGSKWAHSGGCGTTVEGDSDNIGFACGMGHTPKKSARFLYFFTKRVYLIPVGLSLQPEEAFLDLLGDVILRDADYYEVAPETLWRADGAGELVDNGYFRAFAALRERTGRPFVAHGVGFSVGTASRADAPRRRRWLDRIRRDHAALGYRWYTDHLGVTSPAGLAVTLPLALPHTAHAAAVVRRSLHALQAVVPDVGVENTVLYFTLGSPLDEPAFLRRVLRAPRTHLLLDLHNVFTMAQNLGFDPAAYVDRLDLAKVIEIHLSGGSPSDPAWLPSGRVMRLDAHDAAVPEPVWALFDQVAPRCPNLRGVTLERMEGTVEEADVPVIREELRRARAVLERLP